MNIVDANMKNLAVNPKETTKNTQIYVSNSEAYSREYPIVLGIGTGPDADEVWLSREGASQLIQSLLKEVIK